MATADQPNLRERRDVSLARDGTIGKGEAEEHRPRGVARTAAIVRQHVVDAVCHSPQIAHRSELAMPANVADHARAEINANELRTP